MDGFIVLDKPAGMTSHDVVRFVRRITGAKKAGHTGTLDPFATGVLPVALGEGTKAIRFLDERVKEYRAAMLLGEATDTQDATGTVTCRRDWRAVSRDDLARVFAGFRGRISQVPPMYSALKHQGVPLYRIARRGAEVAREPREIEIFSLVVDSFAPPEIVFTVRCSRGTYVRTLAHDMGELLGCGAHLVGLRRTVSGTFALAGAISLDMLASIGGTERFKDIVVSPYDSLPHLPDLQVNERGAARIANGITPAADHFIGLPGNRFAAGDFVRLARERQLLAVAEIVGEGNGEMRLARVFNYAEGRS